MPEALPIGEYIVIEGMDGAGKTTQAQKLVSHLGRIGINAVSVREPGGTRIGESLRSLVLDGEMEKSPYTDFDMFTIARRELRDQVVDPAIESGATVVSDRCWFSSYAYQGFGQGLDLDYISSASKHALTYNIYTEPKGVIIDIEPDVIYERLSADSAKADTFEKQGIGFYEKVRRGYAHLAYLYDVPIIDGHRHADEVHEDIKKP